MITLLLFVSGLLLGSFFNLLIERLQSQKKGIIWGRSQCESCEYILVAKDLVPIASWLILRGRCRQCQEKIALSHPVIELTTGLILAITALLTPIETSSDFLILFWRVLIVLIFWLITIADLKYLTIPDQISLPAIAILLIFLFSLSQLAPEINLHSVISGVLGALVIVSFFLAQIFISQMVGKQLVGGGELRIGALMGLALGWKIALIALFVAYFLGAIAAPILIYWRKKTAQSLIPFGPFLALAVWISLFWGELILNGYLGLIGVM